MEKEKEVARLKEELIRVLTELDEIAPIQFSACSTIVDGVYNFKDVFYAPEDDQIFIEIAMWEDGLPVHNK